jgi:hypothetical protein
MHTHGTAVLDRPAEATVLADTSLSALSTNVNIPGSESAKSINNAAELSTEFGAVRGQVVTELAVALYASGIRPRLFWSATPAQLMQWANQGLALLGINCIRRYATRTQVLNYQYAAHNYNPPAHQAEYDRMWPCPQRTVQSCHDAAGRLFAYASPASQNIPTSRTAL